jgi:hypothetical protein
MLLFGGRMQRFAYTRYKRALAGALALITAVAAPTAAMADAGGLSFWLPGLMGSLAAVPGQPGWSWTTMYVHLDVSANGSKNFVIGGSLVAGLQARADGFATGPTYTFATPVLGGQAAFGVFATPGNAGIDIDATLTGPRGRTISGTAHDERTDFGDVYYLGTLKWNNGVHNTMFYTLGNIPSGTYEAGRLANLSLGYVAVDAGTGYTYLDTKTGNEFSIVGGFTYNFINPYNQYQNGIDSHIDWAASHFLNKNVLVGIAGYYFQQLTGDHGAGARLGNFEGRVVGIGPQIGFMFPFSEGYQGYLNLKAYKDLATENRPEGYTAWVTFAISPAAPSESRPKASQRPRITK